MVKKYSQLYLEARSSFLKQEDQQTASLLARSLLCYVSGKSQEQIIADREMYANQDICAAMEGAVQRVLDLCTGSGCIGLAIANRVKDARVTLADVSRDALAVAKKNITRHKLSARVSCVQADALQPASSFLGKFDMIVSNPPYITAKEMTELEACVRDFEPEMALYGGEDGLDFYRAIVKNYTSALKPGGFLCFEFGMGQGDDVCDILVKNGYTVLERVQDFNERERAVLAQYGGKEE